MVKKGANYTIKFSNDNVQFCDTNKNVNWTVSLLWTIIKKLVSQKAIKDVSWIKIILPTIKDK